MTIHLSILIWLPVALALVAGRRGAILGSLLSFAYSVVLLVDFEAGQGLQYVTDQSWIAELGISYKLGVDGLNLVLVVMTTFLFTLCLVWAAQQRRERERTFYFHFALAHSAVLGALLAQDLALFVVFFDLMLVPFFFLTGIWGEREKVPAITKLFIYTLVGSLLMLTAAIATAVLSAGDGELTFDIAALASADALSEGTQDWIFLCFAAAFLVKMPAFPVHGWMPDGYRAMPLPVLAVFSAVLSKIAAYGFLRVVLPVLPDAAEQFQTLMMCLALASILYGSVLAFTTTNTRLVLGYSSIAQLGFITLGIFALNEQGAQGALIQMVNHGVVVAPAFVIVALLAARAGGSEDLRDMGGIAFRAPVLAALFLIVALANLAMPGSANFVGEFLILLGAFDAKLLIAILAFTGVALASVYTLRLFIRAVHNRVGPDVTPRELSLRDAVVLVPMVLVILALALYPQLPLDKSERAITATIDQVDPPPAPAQPAAAQPALPEGAVPVPQGEQVPVPEGQEVPVPEGEVPEGEEVPVP